MRPNKIQIAKKGKDLSRKIRTRKALNLLKNSLDSSIKTIYNPFIYAADIAFYQMYGGPIPKWPQDPLFKIIIDNNGYCPFSNHDKETE
jgi:hypothetical protein